MSAPLTVDNRVILWYTMKYERRGRPLTFMACSKVRHGTCSRCGKVGESHFRRGEASPLPRTAAQERRALQAEFFKKKARRPLKGQRHLFGGDYGQNGLAR